MIARPTFCVDGRLMRPDPQADDPELMTDRGECPECGGFGCERVAEAERDHKAGITDLDHLIMLGYARSEIDRLRSLIKQACDAIEFDQRENPDCVLAWHLRFLTLAKKELAN